MTRKMILIAGVAGMALAVPALAEKKGQGEAAPQAQAARGGGEKAQRAERPQRAERQQMQRIEQPQRMERQQIQRAERPQRVERQQQRVERQVQRQERQRFERPQRIERQVQRQDRPAKFERQQQRIGRQVQRQERPQKFERQQQRIERISGLDRQQQRVDRRELHRESRQDSRQQQRFDRRSVQQMFGSPDRGEVRTAQFDGRGYRPVAPSFTTRDMRRMKPFKAMFDDRRIVSIGDRFDTSRGWSPVPAIYGSRYLDTPDYYYRYDNDLGYAYQIDRSSNIVRSLYPLFGGYSVGDPWPQTYYSSYVPQGYRDYYYDTPDFYYRNDGYGIYQVDAGTQLITALVSLVMGQGYGIGQALPPGYSAYNVPLDYRDRYADSNDSWYRYGDGYIYQVDPGSRRIAARYPIYADDYYVGDRWPVAYPDYNVPYGYQSIYADTPQYQYRYANNGIYQVDPTNQVILALVALLSGDQFAVGQRMPAGYDIYNVPMDYRDRYADSGDQYYRYANGYVYQVNYGTGLIEQAHPVYA